MKELTTEPQGAEQGSSKSDGKLQMADGQNNREEHGALERKSVNGGNNPTEPQNGKLQMANGQDGGLEIEDSKFQISDGQVEEDIYLWEHGTKVEPWPEAVQLKALLDALEREIQRFVVLGKWVAETLALWVVHTYGFELRSVATYIAVESPEKRCGKTTLLTVLCGFVNRPVVASNISSPAFFRVIAKKRPTLIIDEADTVLHRNRELRSILNAGYAKKMAYVIRVTPKRRTKKGAMAAGKGFMGVKGHVNDGFGDEDLGRYTSWCPKAIATINHLPETLEDRCIIVQMHRKTSKEPCERLRNLDGTELRRKCARFVQDHREAIAKAEPEVPEDLNDRAADIWEPLLALAELAGGDWPQKAREAAVGLTAKATEESPITSLLLDIMVLFAEQECAPGNEWMKTGGVRMFSRDLVVGLNARGERPWMVLRPGKEVTERWLSQQLSPYGLRPRTIWIGDVSAKGYLHSEFMEVFRRYVPKAALRALLDEVRPKNEGEEKPKSQDGGQRQGEATNP